MTKWTTDDIELARQLLALRKQSSTIEDFENGINKIETRYAETLNSKRSDELEAGYQKLLSAVNGNANCLARMLYGVMVEAGDSFQNKRHDIRGSASKATGRPPREMGSRCRRKADAVFLH